MPKITQPETGRASGSNTAPLNLTKQRHRGKERDMVTEKWGGKKDRR